MTKFKLWAAALALAVAGTTGAPAVAADRTTFDVLLSSPRYRNFVRLARASGMDLTLMAKDDITVFVPSDRAVAAMGDAKLRSLMQNPGTAKRWVGCHVVGTELRAGDLYERTTKKRGPVLVQTLGGCRLNVTGKDGKLYVNGRVVVKSNMSASNGLVQEVSGILR